MKKKKKERKPNPSIAKVSLTHLWWSQAQTSEHDDSADTVTYYFLSRKD